MKDHMTEKTSQSRKADTLCRRILSLLLMLSMVTGLLPFFPAEEASAADTPEVPDYEPSAVHQYIGNAKIGNAGDSYEESEKKWNYVRPGDDLAAMDCFSNFQPGNGIPGFYVSGTGWWEYNSWLHFVKIEGTVKYRVVVNEHEALKTLAMSPTAEYSVIGVCNANPTDGETCNMRCTEYKDDGSSSEVFYVEGDVWSGWEDDAYLNDSSRSNVTASSPRQWRKLQGVTEIIADAWYVEEDEDSDVPRCSFSIFFRDIGSPTITSYNMSTNATLNGSSRTLKLGTAASALEDPDNRYSSSNASGANLEYVDVSLTFNKPVKLMNVDGSGMKSSDTHTYNTGQINDLFATALLSHNLFTNALGTGYPGMGQNRGLQLYRVRGVYLDTGKSNYTLSGYSYVGSNGTLVSGTQSMLSRYCDQLCYRYTANSGDYSGSSINGGGGIEYTGSGYSLTDSNGMCTSLLEKIAYAGFYDFAGNPMVVASGSVGTNLLDRSDGGYYTSVDAVPPTYTRTGNGITPDVLTGVTLNKNDTVDFIVSFSENAYIRSGYNVNNTYLLFNNGSKACYVSGNGTKRWTFRCTLKDSSTDTSLWKAIALTNTALDGSLRNNKGSYGKSNLSYRSYFVDGRCIQDAAGNLLSDRVNETKTTNSSQVESSTEFAALSVDNKVPEITFQYKQYSGSSTVPSADGWGQAGKLFVSAEDPDIATPNWDPDQSQKSRPSKGIFRPDNATSASEGAVSPAGLIYYVWSQDEEAPDTGKNFEVIKRFSLTGWDETANEEAADEESPYHAWKALRDQGLCLTAANNYSEIVPPDEAMTEDGSGIWYLHVWTADMTWDSARQLMQYSLSSAQKYNSGYDSASALKKKTEMIESKYQEQQSQNNTGYTYANAESAILASYYNTVYTTQYLGWLDASGKGRYTTDAETYANNEAMKTAGDYADTTVWDLAKFREDDSNWTLETAVVRLDNAVPSGAFDFSHIENDGTANASVTFTVTDANSGVDTGKLYYQWVKKPEGAGSTRPASTKELSALDWIPVESGEMTEEDGTVTVSVTTYNHVSEDGNYYLSVKALDRAGNETILHSEGSVLVNMTLTAGCSFSQTQTAASVYRTVTPTLHVSGLQVGTVMYAVTQSAIRPGDDMFLAVESDGENDTNVDKHYTLPAMDGSYEDGTWYVHVLVWDSADPGMDPYHYSRAYRLDNTEPVIRITPDGSSMEKAEYAVSLTVTDALSSVVSESVRYQWTKSAEAPDGESSGWTQISARGSIRKSITDASENGTYYLHIMAEDAPGNTASFTSSPFLFHTGETVPETADAVLGSQLVAAFNEGSTVYGVAMLQLDEEDKSGYAFSTSADSGDTWTNWVSYSTMIRMPLPVADETQIPYLAEGSLQVRYRTPGGTVSSSSAIRMDTIAAGSLWATAELESSTPRKSGNPLAILMHAPEDVIVTVDSENPGTVEKDAEGDFTVYGNGVYRFTLSKEGERKDFCIVVDVYDDIAPEGYVSYSETDPTRENIVATLETSENTRVTEIRVLNSAGEVTETKPGRDKYTFTENGNVEFVFTDAAGNEGTALAGVENIDREGPDVVLVTGYSAEGTEYATVEAGGKIYSRGLFLTLEKEAGGNGKDYTIIKGDSTGSLEVTKNGSYSFTVADDMGNTAQITAEVDTIIETEPQAEVSYAFASAANAGLVPGETFKSDKVVTTIRFDAPADGRSIYTGRSYRSGAQALTKEGDSFIFTQTYQFSGEKTLYFNDGIGGVFAVPVTVTGIDTVKPSITLNKSAVALSLPEDSTVLSGDTLAAALGGYTAEDRETPDAMTVELTDLAGDAIAFDKNSTGVYTVRYQVTDGAGNSSFADQTVYAVGKNDLFVKAGSEALMNASNNTVILPDNEVTFTVDAERMQQMFYRGQEAQNLAMRYDVYYVSGLYREGQLKYLATQITGEELAEQEFRVTFPKTGWYTIIIRNQERSRIYTTFFISSLAE